MILYMRKKKPEVSYLFWRFIMRYYKIEATVLSDVEIPRKKSDVFDEFADNMRSLSQTFYIKSDKKDYVLP